MVNTREERGLREEEKTIEEINGDERKLDLASKIQVRQMQFH